MPGPGSSIASVLGIIGSECLTGVRLMSDDRWARREHARDAVRVERLGEPLSKIATQSDLHLWRERIHHRL